MNVAGNSDSSEEIALFVTDAEHKSGGIDILYNNPAIMTSASNFFETPECDYEKR